MNICRHVERYRKITYNLLQDNVTQEYFSYAQLPIERKKEIDDMNTNPCDSLCKYGEQK